MKRILLAATAVLALGISRRRSRRASAYRSARVGAGISFEPEHRTRINEYVVREAYPGRMSESQLRFAIECLPKLNVEPFPRIGVRQ